MQELFEVKRGRLPTAGQRFQVGRDLSRRLAFGVAREGASAPKLRMR